MGSFTDLDPAPYQLPADVAARTQSPALVVHLDRVRQNIQAVLAVLDGDPGRWRPHVKTTKIPQVWRELCRAGVRCFKCATTREARLLLQTLDDADVDGDVLLAYPIRPPALEVLGQLARRHDRHQVSVLCEDPTLIPAIPPEISLFVDLNPGMHRTGIPCEDRDAVTRCCEAAGDRLRGLHFYDGHLHQDDQAERAALAHQLYAQLLELTGELTGRGLPLDELITSGTPAFPHATRFEGLRKLDRIHHRVSPGTVVFHDIRSAQLIPQVPLVPAATVFSRIVSHPGSGRVTADAGSKALAAEQGDPCAEVLGWPGLEAHKPSEEHLPLQVHQGEAPPRGAELALVPLHVCPTVNLAEQALLMDGGRVVDVVEVAARAHDLRGV